MYQVSWQIMGEVLRVELAGDISSDEIKALNDFIICNYLNEAERKIHLITIGTEIGKIAAHVGGIAKASEALAAHPNLGLCVYVGMQNPIIAFVANTATKVVGANYKMATSFEDALSILENYGNAKK